MSDIESVDRVEVGEISIKLFIKDDGKMGASFDHDGLEDELVYAYLIACADRMRKIMAESWDDNGDFEDEDE